jgi:hypothetical protein
MRRLANPFSATGIPCQRQGQRQAPVVFRPSRRHVWLGLQPAPLLSQRGIAIDPMHRSGMVLAVIDWVQAAAASMAVGMVVPSMMFIPETNRTEVALFGMQNRAFGPYSLTNNRILISAMVCMHGHWPGT